MDNVDWKIIVVVLLAVVAGTSPFWASLSIRRSISKGNSTKKKPTVSWYDFFAS